MVSWDCDGLGEASAAQKMPHVGSYGLSTAIAPNGWLALIYLNAKREVKFLLLLTNSLIVCFWRNLRTCQF